jgi:hypothetical protein
MGLINNRLKKVLALFSFIALCCSIVILLPSCEPRVTIYVENQTTEVLSIYESDLLTGTAGPGETVKFRHLAIYPTYEIIAKDSEGNTVYSTTFTREDLSGKKTYRVVIPPKEKTPSDNTTGK